MGWPRNYSREVLMSYLSMGPSLLSKLPDPREDASGVVDGLAEIYSRYFGVSRPRSRHLANIVVNAAVRAGKKIEEMEPEDVLRWGTHNPGTLEKGARFLARIKGRPDAIASFACVAHDRNLREMAIWAYNREWWSRKTPRAHKRGVKESQEEGSVAGSVD